MVLAGVGVVAALGVGAVVVQAVVGSGGGGSSSPEGAVDRLAEAIAAEDPVAAAAALAPDEVGSLGDLLDEVEGRAQNEGLAPEGATFAGIDLTAEDLTYEVDELADGIARVTVTDGTLGYSFDPAELGETTRELLGDEVEGSSDEIDISDELDELDDDDQAYLVTVRRDGGWYVSVAYTIAEQAVDGLDLPEADFDAESDLRDPADDPAGAVVALVEGFGQGDRRDVAAALPQDEWSVLGPYQDAIDEALDDDGSSLDADLEVTDIEVEEEDLGDGVRRLRIISAEGTIEDTVEGGEVEWELDGWCFTTDADDFDELSVDSCDLVEDSYIGRALLPDEPSVIVVEDRGGWVVSPVRTLFQNIRDVLPRLDRDLIVTIAGRPELVPPDGEAPFGETFEIELGAAGVATRTVTTTRDLEVVASVDEEVEWSLVDGDGEEPELGGDGYLLEGGVEYRLVVQRDDRSGDALVEVTLGEVVTDDLGDVQLSGTIDGVLTAAEPVRRVGFVLAREVTAEVVVDGPADVDIYEDGEYLCADGEVCAFVPGPEYELVMRSADGTGPQGSDEIPVSVSFEEQAPPPPGSATGATVDGATTASGALDDRDDLGVHEIVVPAGTTVVVTIEADDPDQDVDAFLDGDTYAADGDEEIELEGPLQGELEVFLFSDGPSGYTITLAPG